MTINPGLLLLYLRCSFSVAGDVLETKHFSQRASSSSRCCCLVLFPKLEALSNFLYKLSNAIWPKSPTNCCKALQIIVLWIMCHLKIINHKWCRRIVRVPYKIPCTREVVLLVASYYLDWYKLWRCGPLCVLSGRYVTTSNNRTRCFWSLYSLSCLVRSTWTRRIRS